ncbi:hypothetical protein ACRALDRAFT_1066213, partial [Sodiomyces alcalophilus JCM 7366]|uniref:uncharacterized protein n=1 Tax=Sodiomyces alcalophilus JCM 7366 TaxID=591952 RepID=UPI0039B4821E
MLLPSQSNPSGKDSQECGSARNGISVCSTSTRPTNLRSRPNYRRTYAAPLVQGQTTFNKIVETRRKCLPYEVGIQRVSGFRILWMVDIKHSPSETLD